MAVVATEAVMAVVATEAVMAVVATKAVMAVVATEAAYPWLRVHARGYVWTRVQARTIGTVCRRRLALTCHWRACLPMCPNATWRWASAMVSRIGDAPMRVLAQTLATNLYLEELLLVGNRITDDGSKYIAQYAGTPPCGAWGTDIGGKPWVRIIGADMRPGMWPHTGGELCSLTVLTGVSAENCTLWLNMSSLHVTIHVVIHVTSSTSSHIAIHVVMSSPSLRFCAVLLPRIAVSLVPTHCCKPAIGYLPRVCK